MSDRFSTAKTAGVPRASTPGAVRDIVAKGAGYVLRQMGLPAQLRFLPQALLGQQAFTAADLLPTELAELQAAVERSRTRITRERRQGKTPRQGVQYPDYVRGSNNLRTLAAVLPENALPLSLGRANYRIDPATGATDVFDTYDFLNNARKADIEKYQGALAAEGRLGQLRELLRQSQDYTPQRLLTIGLPQELGEMLLPEGPAVTIRLPRPVTPPHRASRMRQVVLAN